MRRRPHHRRLARSRRRTAAASTWGRRRFGIAGPRRAARGARHTRWSTRAISSRRSRKRSGRRRAEEVHPRDRARLPEAVSDGRSTALDEGALPLVLGGDHSLAAGSVAGDRGVHAARAGKPLGADLGGRARRHEHARRARQRQRARDAARGAARSRSRRSSRGSAASRRRCDPAHTVLIGIRNLDEREKELVRGIGRARLHDEGHRSRRASPRSSEQALAIAATGTAGIHVSFDLDVCDPAIAPGVGTPVKGGLDYREAHMVMEIVADSGLLRALDIVEVNPCSTSRTRPPSSEPSWCCQRWG